MFLEEHPVRVDGKWFAWAQEAAITMDLDEILLIGLPDCLFSEGSILV